MFNDDDLSAINQDSVVNEASIFHHWLEEKVKMTFKLIIAEYLMEIHFMSFRYPNF